MKTFKSTFITVAVLLLAGANSTSALTSADITMLQSAGIISASQAANLSASIATQGYSFTRSLTIGSRGPDVLVLQQFLITGGFLKVLTPTNYFGPLTRAALSAWQVSAGISPSVGYFGSISRARINAVSVSATSASINTSLIQSTTTTSTNNISASTTTQVVTTTSSPSGTVPSAANGSPVRLTISKLGVDAGFQYNGLKSDGSMEIPSNIFDIGWFTGSVRPGERGTSVITGHVAQIRGGVLTAPGVFVNLQDLRPGDRLSVVNDRGQTFTFVVRESRNFDPNANATDVFYNSDNGVHMNIITCEGTWNPALLSYSQRLVVFTDLVQ